MTKMIRENKSKIIISALLVIGVAFLVHQTKDKSQAQEKTESPKTVTVRVEKAEDSHSVKSAIQYPATVAGDQEVKVIAQAGGIATYVGFDLGDQVNQGLLLAKIDDQGLKAGENGFSSSDIQQLELALKEAKKSWSLAKNNYKDDDTRANKTARDIAKLQYENADLALKNAVNGRQVSSPISGIVTSRQISMGDSVAPGQLIATISKNNKLKIQFYVDKDELPNLKLGTEITVLDDNKEVPAKIVNVSPQADPITKRFLIEAAPINASDMFIGTVLSVEVDITRTAQSDNNLLLPLEAVTITPNENYIFILDGETAKKVPVEIVNVSGETAEVKADLSSDSQIIVEGNKLIKDGEKVEVK